MFQIKAKLQAGNNDRTPMLFWYWESIFRCESLLFHNLTPVIEFPGQFN